MLDPPPVRRQLARRDADADDVSDSLEPSDLAAGRGRERLVYLRHARLDGPGRDVGVTVANQSGGFEICVAEAPGDVERRLRVSMHVLWRGRALRASQGEPAPFRDVAGIAEKPIGASQPPAAHGFVAVSGTEFPGEPERTRRCMSGVRSIAEAGIRMLHVRDGAVGIVKPPQGQTQSLVRVCRRCALDRLLERGPSGLPVARCECLPSDLEVVRPCTDVHSRHLGRVGDLVDLRLWTNVHVLRHRQSLPVGRRQYVRFFQLAAQTGGTEERHEPHSAPRAPFLSLNA